MSAQRKDEIVCAFHGDLERKLEEINKWMESINKKLSNLLLWRARVIGYACGASFAIMWLAEKLNIFK